MMNRYTRGEFWVNRFFFTITPPQPVQIFVSSLKRNVRKAIGHGFQDEFSTAHISLFKYTGKTESILYDADQLLAALLPFEIHVKGLGVFKYGDNRSIYLQIEYKAPIADLAIVLGGEEITPHITIARNLDPDDFAKAWESLQSISHSSYFKCNNITVLKREPNRWNRYLELPVSNN
jgi:2'-5' RNA ligase